MITDINDVVYLIIDKIGFPEIFSPRLSLEAEVSKDKFIQHIRKRTFLSSPKRKPKRRVTMKFLRTRNIYSAQPGINEPKTLETN